MRLIFSLEVDFKQCQRKLTFQDDQACTGRSQEMLSCFQILRTTDFLNPKTCIHTLLPTSVCKCIDDFISEPDSWRHHWMISMMEKFAFFSSVLKQVVENDTGNWFCVMKQSGWKFIQETTEFQTHATDGWSIPMPVHTASARRNHPRHLCETSRGKKHKRKRMTQPGQVSCIPPYMFSTLTLTDEFFRMWAIGEQVLSFQWMQCWSLDCISTVARFNGR